MTVTVTGPSGSGVVETFSITADNALILQSRDVSLNVIRMHLIEAFIDFGWLISKSL